MGEALEGRRSEGNEIDETERGVNSARRRIRDEPCPEEEDREDGGSLRSVLPSAPADQPARGRKREPSDPGRVGTFGRDGPRSCGGAKQPNTILTAQAISPPPPEEDGRKEEEFGGGIRRRRRRRRKKTRKRAKAPLRVRPLGTRH